MRSSYNIYVCVCLSLAFVFPDGGSSFLTAHHGSADEDATVQKEHHTATSQHNAIGNETTMERSLLFSRPRTFPFLEQLFNPFGFINQPGPVGPIHPSLTGSFLGGANKPGCASNGLYCLYDKYDKTYPRDRVDAIVDRYYDDVREMHSSLNRIPINDLLRYDNITHKYRDGGHFVCESQVQYIRPGLVRNLKGEWMAVINTDVFPQVVRVEECKYASRRCEYLPPCYKSTCVQRFNFEKLLCVDPLRPSGKPIVDVFEIPSACSCFVENFVYY